MRESGFSINKEAMTSVGHCGLNLLIDKLNIACECLIVTR